MKASNLSQVLQKFTHDRIHDYSFSNESAGNSSFPNLAVNDEIKISIANNVIDRIEAYRLLYSVYVEKEFATPNKSKMWFSLFDAHPDTVTFIAKENNVLVGAITVVFNSEMGLPANDLYADEINEFITEGHKVAEIISLGIQKRARYAQKILIKLFNFAYLAARGLHSVTDLIITVNPKHEPFYKRKLLFDMLGGNKCYEKVGGAEAVLLKLDLKKIEKLVDKIRLEKHPKKTIYQQFFKASEKLELIKKIKKKLKPMTTKEMHYFFGKLPKVLECQFSELAAQN
ncbi:MAG: hypothetical protein COA79_09100 [Planctomycetota bacterium]|nr:MAG: hypothetical protein COA79_09100 [Planctomycetota bacterium]